MPGKKNAVNLRTLAEWVGLAPCSVSAILNNTPASQAIPQTTKERVYRAAAELNYRPNLWARSLRTKRTRMVAAVASDFGRGEVARVVAGVQSRLHTKGYLLALVTPDLAQGDHLQAQFQQRGIEGLIAIDAFIPGQMSLPVASIELGYPTSSDVLTDDRRNWLAALGESAADTIIQQIEQAGMARRVQVEGKLPPAYLHIPSSMLGSAVAVRESA
ncbi:MAG TPA: LacI family DNA-binding transcriptional regulator [Candidatus Sulfotelmatobacter sp.]|nr:LacI family DNA-binding transcriptional regulator [Candidatus Sulfotelmatobacter sp.]